MSRPRIFTPELVRHVTDSFWLDLAYDEEDERLLADHGLEELWTSTRQLREVPQLPSEANPRLWFAHFKRLKCIRVRSGLAFDNAARTYADSHVVPLDGQFAPARYRAMERTAASHGANLDTMTWRCSAAIDAILQQYDTGASADKRNWATLLALYHSELCASATEEVSFGWAKRHNYVLKPEAVGWEIFRWIANHNVSRGHNHLNEPLNAVKGLDTHVDDFAARVAGLARSLDVDRRETRHLLHRLLYLPAVLTLAQSLGDLQRHSERRYYLEKGLAVATRTLRSTYWTQVFSTHTRLAEVDMRLSVSSGGSTRTPFTTETGHVTPRMKQNHMMEVNQAAELNLKASLAQGSESVTNVLADWRSTTGWLLRWHSASDFGFHRRLQATMNFLSQLLRLLKKSTDCAAGRAMSSACPESVAVALEVVLEVRRFIQFLVVDNTRATHRADRSLRCLIDERSRLEHSVKPETWKSGSCVLKCLKALDEVATVITSPCTIQKMREINEWRESLTVVLGGARGHRRANGYHQFRSEVAHLKLFPYVTPPRRICPASVPGSGMGARKCTDSCAARVMEHTSGTPGVARYDSYKWAMYSQQRTFLNYLKFRTGKERSYRTGEARSSAPDFELVSLRRWNSFSPNLGSRAAASVGGGYLVRMWCKNRYVGIAVDPGYNFLENLFNEGFTIADIDIVVVTHAHPDHTENLTNLFTLLFERNKRMEEEEQYDISAPREHCVSLLLTEGVFERYASVLPETKSYVGDVIVMRASQWRGCQASGAVVRVRTDERDECRLALDGDARGAAPRRDGWPAMIQAKRAWHDDLTEHDSIGVAITYWGGTGRPSRVGILGDSKYHKELYRDYADSGVLVGHLGSLISKSFYRAPNVTVPLDAYLKMIQQEEHLYLPGVTRLICDLTHRNRGAFPLMVLSEFGEELRGGLRKDLAKRLACGVQNGHRLPIVPADVGLRIDVERKSIFCSVCHRYEKPDRICVESVLPHEEALAFVCEDCRKLRAGELTKLLEEWCTTGRPVDPLAAAPVATR